MAEVKTNGTKGLDLDELHQDVLSSSTKRRTAKLRVVEQQLQDNDLSSADAKSVLSILFDTYPFYIDRASRQAVHQCLRATLAGQHAADLIPLLVEFIEGESVKKSIAAASAFSLVEWCSVLLQEFATRDRLWDQWGLKIVAADAAILETLFGSSNHNGLKHSALVVTRRALRRVFRAEAIGRDAVQGSVTTLTSKGPSPTTRNAVFLGVIAGVSSRLPEVRPAFEEVKKDYYAFYVREIIGSRSPVPHHITSALHDFFVDFTTLEDLQKEVIPASEKALLRAPEVVLNDLLAPTVQSLPQSIDLSDILQKNLLKPLMSSIKSTNATTRNGAVTLFEAVAARCTKDDVLDKVADEILNPLKQSKVTTAEQKTAHAQMLFALKRSEQLAKKIPQGLAPVAVKEPNETALSAETRAVAKHLEYTLRNGSPVEVPVTDGIVKGLADKRLSVRKVWAMRVGDLLWPLTAEEAAKPNVIAFVQSFIGKMFDSWQEVTANPLPAAQSGLATVAYIGTALGLSRWAQIEDDKIQAALKKVSISKNVLIAEPKPSFLLNHRVYSKLGAEEDLAWGLRALAAITTNVASETDALPVEDAWAQAFLYFITASGIPPNVRKEATRSLSEAYVRSPARIAHIIINGLWQWRRNVEVNEKDTAATTAKSGNNELHLALRAICLSPDAVAQLNGQIDESILTSQLVDLLVLARPELIPRISWIDLCLRTGVDPGDLTRKELDRCMETIIKATEGTASTHTPTVKEAAYKAAADLAFVAPDTAVSRLVEQIEQDLNPTKLDGIGPTEAAIFRTPEGTAFVDVLAKKGSQVPDKGSADYDTLKWEAELRAQLAAKKGQQTKKLTSEEQSKVKAQLEKESRIRKDVSAVEGSLRRGVGIIQSLATGPPTEANLWLGPAIDALLNIIQAGAGLIIADAPASAYISCAERISPRLGVLKPFFGIAALRALNVPYLPEGVDQEALGDLVTRLLYRLRFMTEQRPLDSVSLIYILPLAFLVLEKGAIDRTNEEEADEQIILALEFISFHTGSCSDKTLPRQKLLSILISSLQRFTQHYKLIRDCLIDLCRGIGSDLQHKEVAALVKGAIVPQVAVRTSVLQAIDEEVDLDIDFSEEIWIACHDDVPENVELAKSIWEANALELVDDSASRILPYLESQDKQLRRATARAIAESVSGNRDVFKGIIAKLEETYKEKAKPRVPERDEYGMPRKMDLADPWESRNGVALAFRELAGQFQEEDLVDFVGFMIQAGPLGDRSAAVRDEMIEAAVTVIAAKGQLKVEELMRMCETTLEAPDSGSETYDKVNEAVIIIYGALARHLEAGDSRVPKVVQRLLQTLSTPSETVQYAVAECLPPLVQASSNEVSGYVQQVVDELLQSKKYATRRGAAYGLAGIVRGRGLVTLREYRIMSTLVNAAENKKDQNQRQGAFLAYELLALILGRIFEPYVIQIVPQLLAGFGDASADVREACLDAAKTCFANLSSFGVKQILPTLLEGLDEQQWRSKKGACDSLGAMAYLDPQQLAVSLPEIIPPLTTVLNDSHKEVRISAKRSLQRFGEVISNPEIKSVVDILLKALSDPTKYTDEALDSLIKVNFVHYLDAPSLALVVRILERGLGDRSGTKRKASQIIGSLAHLTERKDLTAHLPILVAGLRVAIVDPVPATRATASKALGSTIEKLGEDALPDLIPSLMATLKSDTGAGDRLGSAQALSEVLAGLGTSRLEETLPTILQNVSSAKASVREGFMSLFIFLPACFGNSFANYLNRIIPPILSGLADDTESIRETALRAGRLLVKNFSTRAIDLLLPELERGLADDNYRIRLSSVELVGDLLFNLTGISANTEQEEVEEGAGEAGQSLLEVLGEDRRNKVLSALYICRCDTSGLVRTAAINVWKALVATPRTLRELIPTLTQLLIRRLASSNMEHKVIAGNALGELIRKAGEGVLATLLPTLEEGLQTSTDSDAKQGICIALRELIVAAAPETLEEYEKTLISVVRTALVDSDAEVREAAAEAFDSLQRIFGKKAVDQVLPFLLNLLRSEDNAQNALSALLTLLTEESRSNIILPNLLPTLLTPPISAFNARAIASLAEVASSAMSRKLPAILNGILDSIVNSKDPEVQEELNASFHTVLVSVDEYDGLTTAMSVMLALTKHDDEKKRRAADAHLAKFFAEAEIDISRYYPDLIRALLVAFNDSDKEVVKAAWEALSELTKRLRKEEMESLVISTRQVLNQVGVAGHDLPGFGLPKGINAILPIFLQGLMNGTAEQRTQAALALSDIIDRTSAESLRPFVTQITGPLIRVVSERSVEVKAAILFTLNNLLEKIPTFLKPFLPQLQRTFAKSLADTSSEILRIRAAKALGTLITLTPRIDPLIAELVTGSKTADKGVKTAMLKALYEVVSKVGANMNEASRNSILGLIDADTSDAEDSMAINNARLLGALIKNLSPETAASLIKNRVLTPAYSKSSVLAINAILAEASDALMASHCEETVETIAKGITHSQPVVSDNCVLAAGKYFLIESSDKSFETTKPIFEALANVIPPGNPVDTRRLALVVTRTVSREHNELVRPHLSLLAPPIFASVRDMVLPIKLAAEAAFLSIFDVVSEEGAVFEKYLAGPGASLPPGTKRSMQEYFKRVAMRLGGQARERKEAEGGQGGLGLSNDEVEDEKEVWSVGKVDLGEGSFQD
ncbi:ARM repeat-containing protein [Saccharata proteae CBS 121410]|uniref:eIF-2-alpha kinase activator GCN1 n=1 Tax=Saccharata proteae CBS 121410 TaxID=1314787 RepID=A0A9P4HXF0_9PEZI|nr:ARM repeat-containing protein [Saccharata proteae CBS 121410]